MLKLYVWALIILSIAMLVGTISLGNTFKERRDKIIGSIIVMFSISVLASSSVALAVATRSAVVSGWAYSVYFASLDWILIVFLYYARQYTRVWSNSFSSTFVMVAISIMDTLLLLGNNRFHNIFTLTVREIPNSVGCYVIKPLLLYDVHLTFDYVVVALIVTVFLIKIFHTAGFHRTQYLTILILFSIIILINAGFMILNLALDLSVVLYLVTAVFIAYFSLYYNPRAFVEYILATVTEKMACAILCFDENDNCLYSNDLANRIFLTNGGSRSMASIFKSWKGRRQINEIPDSNWNDTFTVNGVDCYFDVHFTKIYDKAGYYSGCYFSFYDITSDITAYEEEKYRASHDYLTGALNRESFYKEARKVLDSYPNQEYVIVCSNIKDFKLINEVFGLDMGDKILIRITDMIRSSIQEGTVYARMEADHFAILMPKERYSEKMFLEAMDMASSSLNSDMYRMVVHIGVYDIVDRSVSVATMCDRAYLAIDSIKDSYKQRIAYYGDSIKKEYINEQRIIAEFDKAIAKGEFCMYLQPKIGSDNGKARGAEALVRWNHPENGLLHPGDFIEILEKTGFIYKLDMYIWELACKQLAEWEKKSRSFMFLSVNISVRDFYYIDIYKVLTDLVEKYHVAPERLSLEITETVFMNDAKKHLEVIKKLQTYGFKVEMDDFGSGYSSLNMLKDMSFDVLKIDMAFLSVTEDETRSRQIVTMIISMAKALGMEVVSEGVETKEQVEYLTASGCDLFQGYYFERPIPIEVFEEKYLGL